MFLYDFDTIGIIYTVCTAVPIVLLLVAAVVFCSRRSYKNGLTVAFRVLDIALLVVAVICWIGYILMRVTIAGVNITAVGDDAYLMYEGSELLALPGCAPLTEIAHTLLGTLFFAVLTALSVITLILSFVRRVRPADKSEGSIINSDNDSAVMAVEYTAESDIVAKPVVSGACGHTETVQPEAPQEPVEETQPEELEAPQEPVEETQTEAPEAQQEPVEETQPEEPEAPQEPVEETQTEEPEAPQEPVEETQTEEPEAQQEPAEETQSEEPPEKSVEYGFTATLTPEAVSYTMPEEQLPESGERGMDGSEAEQDIPPVIEDYSDRARGTSDKKYSSALQMPGAKQPVNRQQAKPLDRVQIIRPAAPATSGYVRQTRLLPITRKLVITNRMNVVNMYNEYLKEKQEHEKITEAATEPSGEDKK